MGVLRWAYPASRDELRQCLRDGARLHGGGTGILRRPPSEGTLADLSRTGLDEIAVAGSAVRFGGTATFARVLGAAHQLDPQHVISAALSTAASPGLRNRITLGGSLALFPPWSSLLGPLIALEARVELIGAHEGGVPVSDYLENAGLRRRTAITAIEIDPADGWGCHWFAFRRTRFTYPLLTVTVLTRHEGDSPASVRVVVTGCRGRYRRCRELEERVAADGIPDAVASSDLGTDFRDLQGFSGEYLAHRTAVEISRGLKAAGGAG